MRRRLFGAGRNSSSKLRGEVFEESANSRLEILGSGATFVHLVLCNIAVAVTKSTAIEWCSWFAGNRPLAADSTFVGPAHHLQRCLNMPRARLAYTMSVFR